LINNLWINEWNITLYPINKYNYYLSIVINTGNLCHNLGTWSKLHLYRCSVAYCSLGVLICCCSSNNQGHSCNRGLWLPLLGNLNALSTCLCHLVPSHYLDLWFNVTFFRIISGSSYVKHAWLPHPIFTYW
jgi:hypothetical protein